MCGTLLKIVRLFRFRCTSTCADFICLLNTATTIRTYSIIVSSFTPCFFFRSCMFVYAWFTDVLINKDRYNDAILTLRRAGEEVRPFHQNSLH